MSQTNEEAKQAQIKLIQALLNSALYPHPVGQVELIETHISFVLLAGEYAYKIKKPVDFGFLDFSSLEKRKYYCEEEIRLNRRHAATIYLGVVAIGGTLEKPVLNATQNIVEYAVKMRRFAQQDVCDHALAEQHISNENMDVLAQNLVDFHQSVAVASVDSDYGCLEQIKKYTLENVSLIEKCLRTEQDKKQLSAYQQWLDEQHRVLAPLLNERKQRGFIRECHGDLHLRNILFSHGHFVFFDCIEFNPDLRWVDVLSELAFLAMDLVASGHAAFSHRLINQYIELTGDYAGLPLLRYYLAYRAMVRCKVAFLRLSQGGSDSEKQTLEQEGLSYLALACRFISDRQPELIITHGLSGSGKSRHSLALLEHIGAIRVRSDVERKRLHGLSVKEANALRLENQAYNPHNTEIVYQRLLSLVEHIINAGYPAIVDATCLKRWQRDLFRCFAEQHQIKFSIVHYDAPLDELRRRIESRQVQQQDVSDASLEVLDLQIKTAEAFTALELPYVRMPTELT